MMGQDDLWLEDDNPLAKRIDALWEQAQLMADAPPRPAKDYVVVSLAWLARVAHVVHTPQQLVVAEVLYRQCLVKRSRTVVAPTGLLQDLGIDRNVIRRTLANLKQAGTIATEFRMGHPTQVTFLWFP
jgi:hypothetical protein